MNSNLFLRFFKIIFLIIFVLVLLIIPFSKVYASNLFGEQKTLVILYNFQNNPDDKLFTVEEIKSLFFSDSSSINNYFKENSFNVTWLSGTVAGWYTVSFNSNDTSCRETDASLEAENMAKAEGFNIDYYSHLVFLHPIINSCGSGGSSDAHKIPTKSYITLTSEVAMLKNFITHELGHSVDLGHAHALDCFNKAVNIYTNCNIRYYGDHYGVMGGVGSMQYRNFYHLNAFHKSFLGWIPSTQTIDVSKSGIYTLYPLEKSSTNPQMIKIRKADTNQDYYLEYRQPIGFDSSLPLETTRGVLIHIGYLVRTEGAIIYDYPETYLIDTTPKSLDQYSDFIDASLTDGASFYDAINNIKVEQISHDSDKVIVSITLNSCKEDINQNSIVDIYDLLSLLRRWGLCSGCREDINNDGSVNVQDLLMLLRVWGPCSS